MDEATRQQYERAAEALENGDLELHGAVDEIATRACLAAERMLPKGDGPDSDSAAIDNRAARLLHECVASGKTL